MGNKSRIPTTIDGFNTYINKSDDYLNAGTPTTNGIRLGLTSGNLTDWSAKRTYWKESLYPAHSNPNTRTKTVNQNVKTFMKDFRTFGSPLLNICAASPNATQEDANALNFVLVRKAPTHPTEPIMENCFATAEAQGSGVRFSFRTNHDAKRASLAKGADSIQAAYKIGDPAPASENDKSLSTFLITKATYKHPSAPSVSGQKFYFYVRWYNTKYPNLAGGWSKLYNVVLP